MACFFVDVEATHGRSPFSGKMTEFGAVELQTGAEYHGVLYDSHPDPENPVVPIIEDGAVEYDRQKVMTDFAHWLQSFDDLNSVFISDNPAYDFMWIAYYFDSVGINNPFGHSGRRIGDLYAGAMMGSGQGSWKKQSKWKRWRITKHSHAPQEDARGNREAFLHLLNLFHQEI